MLSLLKFSIFALVLTKGHGLVRGPKTSSADRELRLIELRETAAKNQIVSYNKEELKAAGGIAALTAELKETCQCKVEPLEAIGAFILHYTSADHMSAEQLKMKVKDVAHASEDHVYHMEFGKYSMTSKAELIQERQSSTPNDPKFGSQWALQSLDNNADINCQEGWQAYKSDSQGGSADGPSVVVAVIDSGVDYNHPDLKSVMWQNPDEIAGNGIDDDGNGIVDDVYGADFTSDDKGNPIDRNGHGTHCAGVIAAPTDNGVGIAGIAGVAQGKVKIMALKGLDDNGDGTGSSLFGAINYAITKGAQISSNSWGGSGNDGGTLADILSNNPNHLFIAAAGNDGQQITTSNPKVTCSTNAANQICVGSTNSQDGKSWFSNYGKPYVHVMAPGSEILSTIPNSAYGSMSGTSMACPQVTGLAALLTTMRGNLTPVQIKQLIEDNVQSKSQYADDVTTSGLIDVLKTVQATAGGSTPDTTTKSPSNDVCIKITTTTNKFGYENSWTFGSCSWTGVYGTTQDNQDYEVECCQPAGSYDLTCKCSYGDGWHGGFVTIGDSDEKLCEDFKEEDGSSKVVKNVVHPNADVCINLKLTTVDWGKEISWTFGSCSSGDTIYGDNQDYDINCCQQAGTYVFDCKDEYGDGWHGGYMNIGGTKVCEDFSDGSSQKQNVVHSASP